MENENFDFSADVISRSQEVPVLVDFWSPTCGPCLFLGPVLEKLAAEANGKWELVKVNTMFNQELAMKYNITSIPAVKLFHKGEIVNEFVGALPEGTLRKWLNEFLPDERKDELAAIVDGLQQDRTLGLAKLRGFVNDNPDLHIAKLTLAGELLFESPEDARDLVNEIPREHLLYNNAESVRILTDILVFETDQEGPVYDKLKATREALYNKDFELAIEMIVKAVEDDKNAADELPRRGTIALFRYFGMNHPLTQKFKRKFEMALY